MVGEHLGLEKGFLLKDKNDVHIYLSRGHVFILAVWTLLAHVRAPAFDPWLQLLMSFLLTWTLSSSSGGSRNCFLPLTWETLESQSSFSLGNEPANSSLLSPFLSLCLSN